MKKNAIISGCLLGLRCRYDGESRPLPEEALSLLKHRYNLIPVCAEQLGGLPTPRIPCEIKDKRVVNRLGEDVTEQYIKGAEEVLLIAKGFGCKTAILKQNSPSCGKGKIHNGCFDGGYVIGNGITADLLIREGIEVIGEEEILKEVSG